MRKTVSRIESILSCRLRPNFLAVSHDTTSDHPFIHIVISANSFNKRSVDERIATVFDCLHTEDKDLVEKNTIVVEAFSSNEMADIFQYLR